MKNKIIGLVLILVGIGCYFIDGQINGACVFVWLIGIPMMFVHDSEPAKIIHIDDINCEHCAFDRTKGCPGKTYCYAKNRPYFFEPSELYYQDQYKRGKV